MLTPKLLIHSRVNESPDLELGDVGSSPGCQLPTYVTLDKSHYLSFGFFYGKMELYLLPSTPQSCWKNEMGYEG